MLLDLQDPLLQLLIEQVFIFNRVSDTAGQPGRSLWSLCYQLHAAKQKQTMKMWFSTSEQTAQQVTAARNGSTLLSCYVVFKRRLREFLFQLLRCVANCIKLVTSGLTWTDSLGEPVTGRCKHHKVIITIVIFIQQVNMITILLFITPEIV